MPFNGTKTRTWGSGTAAYADYFDDEFDRLYANDVDLDTRLAAIEAEADSVKVTGDQTVAGVKTFSSSPVFSVELQIANGANIANGFSLEHNGNPVAGYYDDGTPYYVKRLTGTANGSGYLELNHGIADYSKIQSVRARMKNTSSSAYHAHDYIAIGPAFAPDNVTWTATKVIAEGALVSEEIVFLVEYIT